MYSARTQRMTQDKQWDGGPYRFRSPIPAHVSAETAKEHAVMRYEDHGAFKILQGVLQHFLGRTIQVIMIVGSRQAPGSSAGCRACALLPAATFLRRRVCGSSCPHVFAGEPGTNAPARFRSAPETVLGKILLQLFDDGEIGIEDIQRLLREVAIYRLAPSRTLSASGALGSGFELTDPQRGTGRFKIGGKSTAFQESAGAE